MRNIIECFFIAVLPAFAVSGCIRDDVYWMHGDDDPGYTVFSESYVWQVNNFFRCVEMCDFFTEYQKIRQDREASEKLAGEYFGDAWTDLYYEKMAVAETGTLYNEGEGYFLFRPYEIPDWRDTTFRMEAVSVGEGAFRITCTSVSFSAEALMRVDGATVYMDSFSSSYAEPVSNAVMKVGTDASSGTVSLPRCASDGFSYVPERGALAVDISGDGVDDAFRVLFYGDRIGISRTGRQTVYYDAPSPFYAYNVDFR